MLEVDAAGEGDEEVEGGMSVGVVDRREGGRKGGRERRRAEEVREKGRDGGRKNKENMRSVSVRGKTKSFCTTVVQDRQ